MSSTTSGVSDSVTVAELIEVGQNISGQNITGYDANCTNDYCVSDEEYRDMVANCTNDYCVSDEDYRDMIEAFIYPETSEWVLIAVYSITFLVGVTGNFLVCFALWRNRSMRTVTNIFIVNLALSDLTIIIVCLPPTLIADATESWFMGRAMCKIVLYLMVCTN